MESPFNVVVRDSPDQLSNSMLLGLNRGGKRESGERIEDDFSFSRMLWVSLTRDWGGAYSGLHWMAIHGPRLSDGCLNVTQRVRNT